MPERLQYDEAMLFSSIRLKIPDFELKQGQVEKITIQTKAGTVVRPWGIEGGFAVVYKFRTSSGKLRALRCFRVPMNPDTQFRYERIGPYFHTHASDFTVRFKYHDAAITVNEQGKPKGQTYPVIEMDWIDGLTLLEQVDELCEKRDHRALKDLSEQWLGVLKTLRQANIAHGDLAGVNVMVKPDGRLVLIDYDGVYIPDFTGLPQVLLGQEHYQHPQMHQREFDEHMDDFSALVIYVALIALTARPELWDKYMKRNSAGKLLDSNLLFTQQDFKEPYQSALIRELERVGDAQIRAAVQELKRLCLQPVDQVQFPFQLIDPNFNKKLALEQLDEAVRVDDDALIAASWLPVLDSYQPAQHHRQRVQEAQQGVQALEIFRQAIQAQKLQQIVAGYNSILDRCKNVTQDERELLGIARRFVQAYNTGDDDALLVIADIFQNTNAFQGIIFTAQEQQRFSLAHQRKLAQEQLRSALISRNIEAIATAYHPGQYPYQGLSEQERQQAEMVRTFVQAYNSDDDAAIITAYDVILNFKYAAFPIFTLQHQQRIILAQRRTEALTRFQVALRSRNPRHISAAYDPILDTSKNLTLEERNWVASAKNFTQAYDANDALALVAAYDAIQTSAYRSFFIFSTGEQQRIAHAVQHNQALARFLDALKGKRPCEVVAAYDPILETSKNLAQEERDWLALAERFLKGYADDDDDTLFAVASALQNPGSFIFTTQEQQRITLACQRHAALVVLRKAFKDHYRNAQRLLAAYDPALLDASKNVTQEQRAHVELARDYLKMQRDVQAAIRSDNDDLVINAYNKTLDQEFNGFTPAERERLNSLMKSLELKELLLNRKDEHAIRMAWNLVKISNKEVRYNLLQLHLATKRFIKQHDLTGLQVYLEENMLTGFHEAVVRWRWPLNELVREGLIVWRADTWPQRPQEKSWQDPEWHYLEVHRKSNQVEDEQRLSIGRHRHIYVQGYARMLDDWDPEHMLWRYSDGFDPASRQEAGNQRLLWRHYG